MSDAFKLPLTVDIKEFLHVWLRVTSIFISLEWGPETASGGIHSLGETDLKKRVESEGGCTYQDRTEIEMKIVTF